MSPEEKEDMRDRAETIAALFEDQVPPVAAGILAMVLAAMIATRAKDREAAIAGFVSSVRAHLAKGGAA